MLAFLGCSNNSTEPKPAPVSDIWEFDIKFDSLVVDDDGNDVGAGKFFWVIGVVNENDSMLTDKTGKDAYTTQTRDKVFAVNTGQALGIAKTFKY